MASRRKSTQSGTSEKLPLRIIYFRFEITRKFTSTPSHNLLKRFECSYITSASLFSLRLPRVLFQSSQVEKKDPPLHQQFAQIRVDKKLWKWSSGAVLQHKPSIKRFSTVNISKEFKIVPDMEFAFKSMSRRLSRNLLNDFSTNETNYFGNICSLRVSGILHCF